MGGRARPHVSCSPSRCTLGGLFGKPRTGRGCFLDLAMAFFSPWLAPMNGDQRAALLFPCPERACGLMRFAALRVRVSARFDGWVRPRDVGVCLASCCGCRRARPSPCVDQRCDHAFVCPRLLACAAMRLRVWCQRARAHRRMSFSQETAGPPKQGIPAWVCWALRKQRISEHSWQLVACCAAHWICCFFPQRPTPPPPTPRKRQIRRERSPSLVS